MYVCWDEMYAGMRRWEKNHYTRAFLAEEYVGLIFANGFVLCTYMYFSRNYEQEVFSVDEFCYLPPTGDDYITTLWPD